MSFLLDPFALLLIGFVVGKLYYLALAFGDRIIRRGASKKGLLAAGAAVVAIFWAYSGLLYEGVIYFPWPFPRWYSGPDWMLNSGLKLGLARSSATDVLAVVAFATYPLWFYLGSELALAGQRMTRAARTAEGDKIVGAVVDTIFPKGGAIPPGAAEVGTLGLVDSLFTKIPPAFASGLKLLIFVFDSRFFVLFFTGRFARFVSLDPKERGKYLQAWDSNPYLSSATQILRIAASYGYYTRPRVYKEIGYGGPARPADPPWFVSGSSARGGSG